MKNNIAYFTAGEFAKLHHINKRTLHYYDDIKLFSPQHKKENGYRYYTYEQSMELENILALRELGMSIEEVKNYTQQPNSKDFLNIARTKIEEIEKSMNQLKNLKAVLIEKEEVLKRCEELYDGKIEMASLKEEYLLMTPLALDYEGDTNLFQNTQAIMNHLRDAWAFCTYKKSCGSYITLDKVRQEKFDDYDGVFSVVDVKKKNLFMKPKGLYVRGFCIGDWGKLPKLYEEILAFAKEHQLQLTGYAFERGINEFAISDMKDYVTQVEIKCEVKD